MFHEPRKGLREKIIAMAKQGKTAMEIGTALNTGRSYVYKVCDRACVQLKYADQRSPLTMAVLTSIKAGLASTEVAEKHGITVAHAHAISNRYFVRFKQSAHAAKPIPKCVRITPYRKETDWRKVHLPANAVRAAGIRNAEKLTLHVEQGRIILTRME